MANSNRYYQLIEEAPAHLESTAQLFRWSENFDCQRGPATLFLDLIGYSANEFGQALYELSEQYHLGYMELDYLADALKEYASTPDAVYEFVEELIAAENEDNSPVLC